MKRILLGFLVISSLSPVFADQSFTIAAAQPVGTPLSASTVSEQPMPQNAASKIANAPVNPTVAQETQGVFQSTKQNLNLYVTQLQCQSKGINSSSCNQQNAQQSPVNSAPTVLNSVNKFLFNSVTSSLGVGVEVNF